MEATRSKIVIRNLPPLLEKQNFLETINFSKQMVSWFDFIEGKLEDKKLIESKAIIGFSSYNALKDFLKNFQNQTFVGAPKEREYKPEITYSYHQKQIKKTPPQTTGIKTKTINEHLLDTIDSDPVYIEFLKKLKEPIPSLPSASEQYDKKLQEEQESSQKLTPLVEFLNQRRKEEELSDFRLIKKKERKISFGKREIESKKKKKEKRRRIRKGESLKKKIPKDQPNSRDMRNQRSDLTSSNISRDQIPQKSEPKKPPKITILKKPTTTNSSNINQSPNNQSYLNQSYSNQSPNNQSYSNQSPNNQSYSNQSYSNQSYSNQHHPNQKRRTFKQHSSHIGNSTPIYQPKHK